MRKNVPTDRSASPLTAAQPARSLRRASPDSDCIEVEEKPEETQVRFIIRPTMEYVHRFDNLCVCFSRG